jgi:acyl dehydratase
MTRRPLGPDIVGMEGDPVKNTWTHKDVILYALGVGAKPEGELDYVYEGRGPKVLPTYAVIPGMSGWGVAVGKVEVNPMMILHGEQSVTLHRDIPPTAEAETKGRIKAVWDKGKAAVIELESVTSDADGPLFTTTAALFVRGAGGFGGDRGPSAGEWVTPDRAPDYEVTYATREEQAAIYRLSGDLNPLHIDPEFAKAAGFDKPFIHGLCTYGFVGRAILHTVCGGDPSRFGEFKARFADRVYPGDSITTRIWSQGDGSYLVEARTERGLALTHASFSLRA